MALANPTPASDRHRQPSPAGLTLNLPSNNPFRNRATSPSPRHTPDTTLPPSTAGGNMSNNPFLDASERNTNKTNTSRGGPGNASDLFKELSLLDKPDPPMGKMPPPARSGTMPTQGHRPTGSDERRERPRGPPIAALNNPQRRGPSDRPHQRRASASSVMDRDEKERLRRDYRDQREARDRERGGERRERTESEERRRRERRREREERHRREKEKIRAGDKGTSGKSSATKKAQGLDIIDKLDVTGIYGPGLFHHDGPFDACNPHRNRQSSRRAAPMEAFPKNSANMALGGSGPVNSRIDLDKFSGHGQEGFADYAATRKADTTRDQYVVGAHDKIEQIHNDETQGLGTSTFLEGAPAATAPGGRKESEDYGLSQTQPGANGNSGMGSGLTRKKSLAQRFRGMSASRRAGTANDGLRSPDARYANGESSSPPSAAPPSYNKAMSAGGPLRAKYTRENEINPFDENYDQAFERKGQAIRIAEQEHPARRPSEVGPGPRGGLGLVRSVTSDSAEQRPGSSRGLSVGGRGRSGSGEEKTGGGAGGFLSRMKSLKGGRRARPERRDT